MLCSEAIAVNRNDHMGEISLLRCKRWSCEICNPRNRWKVIKAIARGRPNRLLTLTCKHGDFETPDLAARAMKAALVALRKRMARQWPNRRFPMAIVFEAHKSGWPHMHVAIRSTFVPIQWLRDAWQDIIGAWNVDIRFVPCPEQAARYVAKYMGKDLHHFEGCKRWWRTHDYQVEKEETRIKVTYGNGIVIEEGINWESYVARCKADEWMEILEERPGWFKFSDWFPSSGRGFAPRAPLPIA